LVHALRVTADFQSIGTEDALIRAEMRGYRFESSIWSAAWMPDSASSDAEQQEQPKDDAKATSTSSAADEPSYARSPTVAKDNLHHGADLRIRVR
jgi:hypothetical protein